MNKRRQKSQGIIIAFVLILIGIIIGATLLGAFTRKGFNDPEVPSLINKVINEAEKVRDLESTSPTLKEGTIDSKGRFVEKGCVIDGCSGQLCVSVEDFPQATTCEYREEYACFEESYARCEKQDDNKCNWTQNTELKQCLNNIL